MAKRKMIRTQSIKVVLLCVLLFSGVPLYADIPWLHVDGNKIKDPEGNVVVLRGISLIDLGFLEDWQGGAINMIDRITDKNDSQGNSPGWYPKILRIPIHPPDSVDNWPLRWDPDDDSFYNNLLRPVVDYCAAKDLYVIIDWHYITNTWDKLAQTSEFWRYMAPRFANDSHVLFELFNEPVNLIGSDTDNWLSVRTDMQMWVDIVRTYAPHNLILVAGPGWSMTIGPAATYPVSGNNIVYVSHLYPAHWLGAWADRQWYRNQITTCAAVHPVIMTEWGFTTTSEMLLNGTISNYGQSLMDFIEGLQIGNTAWVASCDWGPPMFYNDWTLRCGEGEMGGFVKDTLYEKRNDDLPHGAVQTPVDLGTPSTEDFETDDFSGFPWRRSGDSSWDTTRQQSHSGSYCAKSGSIEDDESTTLQVTLDCSSGDITFYRKVSSESGYDFLKFNIDGVEKGKWSGEEGWTEVSFPVNEGTRTFEWTYSKDGSASEGQDAAWIDDIVFPVYSISEQGIPLPLTASVEITTWQDNKQGACSFTFDDNLKTQLSHFVPKFRDLGFTGTVFLVTGDWGIRAIYESYSQYAELVDSGWEIGSHTVRHPSLTDLNDSSLESELANSRATLETLFDLPPGMTLAYPFTASDTRVRNMAAQYYIAARAGGGRTISPDMSKWSLEGYEQFNLPSYGWTASQHDLNSMNSAIDNAISRGEWIVEMIHGTNGDGWEPPAWESVYEPHFDYIKSRENDLWICTFGDVYRYIAERDACKVSVQAFAAGTAVVLTNESMLPPTPVPLTIKIDIPDEWNNVTVRNNDKVISGRMITESQNKHYLAETIPTDTPKELYVVGDMESTKIPLHGVNLTNWLQAPSIQQIQFTKFTKQDFINIKSLGCDVIRLPINLHAMTSGAPDYKIDPLFYNQLDQIIDWAEELKLHLILDNHSFDPAVDTSPDIGDILIPVWTQMAQHYRDRSTYLYYEVLNEPHGISDTTWNQIQQEVINAIRAVDQTHTIIVGPAGWNSYNNLEFMPEYQDDKLIYTFHFYDPFLFTHQGASWTDPSLVSLASVPFPYYASDITACPMDLQNTWVQSSLTNYRNTGTADRLKELIDIAVDFQKTHDVPLFCGEFGVYKLNSNNENRIYWYSVVRNYLEQKGIAWTMWDYKGGFGLFEQGSSELFDYDLNVPLVKALGFVAPPQGLAPTVDGIDLYLDDVGPYIIASSGKEGLLDYYSQDHPASGDYCIHWTGVDQYGSISFRFSPIKDLSLLVGNGFAVDFWVRCNNPSARFDIRFIDTKTEDPGDHPWRMRYGIDRNIADWNGEWNHLQISLSAFSEGGSWDSGWFNPIGAYDWTATDRFEIVSEYGNLKGIHFYFDDIRVVDPNTSAQP